MVDFPRMETTTELLQNRDPDWVLPGISEKQCLHYYGEHTWARRSDGVTVCYYCGVLPEAREPVKLKRYRRRR